MGIRVHDYIAMYLDKLIDGSVPHERTDRRVFRQIWEHKKVMHERLTAVENVLKMSSEISTSYAPLVDEANTMRMLYASHCVKSRMSIIPTIKKKLINIRETEQRLLENFTNKMERELK